LFHDLRTCSGAVDAPCPLISWLLEVSACSVSASCCESAPAATSAGKKPAAFSASSCGSRPGALRSGLYQLKRFSSRVRRRPVVRLVVGVRCQIVSPYSA
jgi:hypothetical protein